MDTLRNLKNVEVQKKSDKTLWRKSGNKSRIEESITVADYYHNNLRKVENNTEKIGMKLLAARKKFWNLDTIWKDNFVKY